jgi:hypothetical protein
LSVAGTALLLLLPLLGLIALIIRLDRPARRSQHPARPAGRPFTMYKFRSMCGRRRPQGPTRPPQRLSGPASSCGRSQRPEPAAGCADQSTRAAAALERPDRRHPSSTAPAPARQFGPFPQPGTGGSWTWSGHHRPRQVMARVPARLRPLGPLGPALLDTWSFGSIHPFAPPGDMPGRTLQVEGQGSPPPARTSAHGHPGRYAETCLIGPPEPSRPSKILTRPIPPGGGGTAGAAGPQ